MNETIRYILLLFGFTIGCLCGFVLRTCTHDCERVEVVCTDTIRTIRRDTIRTERVVARYIYDTLIRNDTVYIADVPQIYADSTPDYSLKVRAVKMYDYRLDIFRADTFTRYIQEKPAKPKKRGKMGQSVVVGLQVGYGLGVKPATMQAQFSPYIGVGITYGFGITF